jgi:DNA invertase Pin-like site-specific DNA recombinase
MPTDTPARRAIGIVRVSQKKDREGESFVSPADQRARIRAACERDGLRLVNLFDELDVSGGKPLDERPGLGPAVRAVERGEAEVIAAAYFDRLFRSLAVQAEVVDRVERAGERVLAVDVGRVTNGSAAQTRQVPLGVRDGRARCGHVFRARIERQSMGPSVRRARPRGLVRT